MDDLQQQIDRVKGSIAQQAASERLARHRLSSTLQVRFLAHSPGRGLCRGSTAGLHTVWPCADAPEKRVHRRPRQSSPKPPTACTGPGWAGRTSWIAPGGGRPSWWRAWPRISTGSTTSLAARSRITARCVRRQLQSTAVANLLLPPPVTSSSVSSSDAASHPGPACISTADVASPQSPPAEKVFGWLRSVALLTSLRCPLRPRARRRCSGAGTRTRQSSQSERRRRRRPTSRPGRRGRTRGGWRRSRRGGISWAGII